MIGISGAMARRSDAVLPSSSAARCEPTAKAILWSCATAARARLIASARIVPPVIAPIIIGAASGLPKNSTERSIAESAISGKAQWSKHSRSNPLLPDDFVAGSSARSICASLREAAAIFWPVKICCLSNVIRFGALVLLQKIHQQESYAAQSTRQDL